MKKIIIVMMSFIVLLGFNFKVRAESVVNLQYTVTEYYFEIADIQYNLKDIMDNIYILRYLTDDENIYFVNNGIIDNDFSLELYQEEMYYSWILKDNKSNDAIILETDFDGYYYSYIWDGCNYNMNGTLYLSYLQESPAPTIWESIGMSISGIISWFVVVLSSIESTMQSSLLLQISIGLAAAFVGFQLVKMTIKIIQSYRKK